MTGVIIGETTERLAGQGGRWNIHVATPITIISMKPTKRR